MNFSIKPIKELTEDEIKMISGGTTLSYGKNLQEIDPFRPPKGPPDMLTPSEIAYPLFERPVGHK